MVNLDFIGQKGEHILHKIELLVARRTIIVLYKFERERRKFYLEVFYHLFIIKYVNQSK